MLVLVELFIENAGASGTIYGASAWSYLQQTQVDNSAEQVQQAELTH